MAGTAEGRYLTDQHRRWQATLGATMVGVTMDLASLINPENIPETFDHWLEEQLGALEAVRIAGADEAARYMMAYRTAEIGPEKATRLPVISHEVDLVEDARSLAWAPWVAQAAIQEGQDPAEAWNDVVRKLAWKTHNLALESGRNVVSRSVEKAGGKWRRVSDGNPCAWCAMLVTRGPVYTRETVTSTYAGRRYHYKCGCTPEEVFGEWEPTAEEQSYIDLYESIRASGDTDKEITAKMRLYGQGVVNDASGVLQNIKKLFHPNVKSPKVEDVVKTINAAAYKKAKQGVDETRSELTIIDKQMSDATARGDMGAVKSIRARRKALEATYMSQYVEFLRVQSNCTHCVNAFELAMRGKNVTAKPLPMSHITSINPTRRTAQAKGRGPDDYINMRWMNADGSPADWRKLYTRVNGLDEAKATAGSWPVGGRGIVYVEWQGQQASHVFNVVKTEKDVIFADAQVGEVGSRVEGYFARAKKGSTLIFRVDELEPSKSMDELVDGI